VLVFLLIYLASPIDLVPDFVQVLGYADDAVIVGLVLRSIARRAGPDALARHIGRLAADRTTGRSPQRQPITASPEPVAVGSSAVVVEFCQPKLAPV